jgi:hypothetical protein
MLQIVARELKLDGWDLEERPKVTVNMIAEIVLSFTAANARTHTSVSTHTFTAKNVVRTKYCRWV